jgi:predicted PurR-regulated permease PerM
MPRKIEISHRTIIFTVFFLIFLWVILLIKDIILEFFLALLIMAVFDPLVTRLSRRNIPRSASVLIVYILLFSLVGLAVASIVPSLVDQTTSFINNLPRFLNSIGISSLLSGQIMEQAFNQIGALPAKVAETVVSLFSNILGIVAVFVFAFYLLSEREDLKNQIGILVGVKRKYIFERALDLIEDKLGKWARAEVTLMIAVGLANFIGLRLLNIPFALSLSILAGTLEIVPYIGPVLAAVPAVLIGFGISPIIGLAVAALAFLIQQLENYVLVPKIMQKNIGVNPIIILVVLAIGARLAGVIGLLVSIPIYISLQVIVQEFLTKEENSSDLQS